MSTNNTEALRADAERNGAILARIALRPNMINVNTAEAQLLAARISLQNQASDLERYKQLRAQKIISESQFDQYTTSYNLQKEAVSSAEKISGTVASTRPSPVLSPLR